MVQLKWIWKNMEGKRAFVIAGWILAAVSSAMSVFIPKFTQLIIDDVFKGDMSSALFLKLLIIMLAVKLLRTVIRYVMTWCLEISSQKTIVTIERKLFSSLVTQESEFFDRNRTGDIIARTTGDLDYIRHVVAGISRDVVSSAVLLVSAIVMLATMHIGLTVSMLIITPLIVIITYFYSKKIRPLYIVLRNKTAYINTVAQENIAGNRVVKAFTREEYEKEKFDECCRDANDYTVWLAIKQQKFSQTLAFITDILGVILIAVGGYYVVTSQGNTGVWQLTIGELAAFSALRNTLASPLRELGTVANDFQRFMASADKVMEIYYAKPLISDRSDCVDTDKRLDGKITFHHVSFAFNDKQVLDDVSFEIKPQESIAIMGPTGSGKTVLLNLICRMYEPDKGQVYIDDINVHMWKLSKLHSSIGVAMQDVFLFSDSIKSNIAYGDPDMAQDEIDEYSKIADAHGFISEMDEKYETIVGERGVGLSGGQRQRIALARALAVKPPILMLDDTTSAVDMETEKHIQEELDNLDFPCTKIMIAQRISSVRRADRIFILKDGKLEIGTHETLSAKPGYYRDICKLQNVADIPEIPGEEA